MADSSERIVHPVLGVLEWPPEFSHWFTQLQLPSGDRLDVIVDPGDSERSAFLPRAAELSHWAFVHERRMLAEAMRAELLEMYNDVWRQGDEPLLTDAGLTSRLEWTLFCVSASDVVPVEFGYDAGERFGGHGPTVGVDAQLRFRSVGLRG